MKECVKYDISIVALVKKNMIKIERDIFPKAFTPQFR